MKSLALLGPSRGVVKAARRLGHPLLMISPDPETVQFLDHPYDQYLQVDYRDRATLEEVCDTILSKQELVWLTAFPDDAQLPAAWARERLGLPGLSADIVGLTVDKFQMRARLQDRTPTITVPACLTTDHETARTLFRSYGSLMVKPIDGSGSAGVRRIDSTADLEACLASADSRTMLEPFVDGVELVVDTHSLRGTRTHVAVAGKWMTPTSIDIGLIVPAPVDDATRLRVEHAVELMLDALEIETGCTHTEVLVSPDRVTIIETHTRPAGDGLTDLVYAVSGVDWRATGLDVGITGEFHRDEPRVGAAAAVFWTAPPGRVVEVMKSPPPLKGECEMWWTTAEVGDLIPPTLSSDDRLGGAAVMADDVATCVEDAESLLRMDVIRTEPV